MVAVQAHAVFLLPRGDKPEVAVNAADHGQLANGVDKEDGRNHHGVQVQLPASQLGGEERRRHSLHGHGDGGHGSGAVRIGVKGEQGLQAVGNGAVAHPCRHRQEH